MKKTLIVATVAAMIATPAFADNTDVATVTVGGTVVASLVLGNTTAAVMPDVVLPDTDEDTFVTMTCDVDGVDTITYDALGGNPFADGVSANDEVQGGSANTGVAGANSTGTCATIPVTGQADFNYIAVYAVENAGVPQTDGTGILLSDPTCANAAGPMVSGVTTGVLTGGTDTLQCGATITVDQLASAGSYADATFTVTVTYD